jgi:O-6-methylguanine DNA methyltransferase
MKMKGQIKSSVLNGLPIIGSVRLITKDLKTLSAIELIPKQCAGKLDPFFEDCYSELHAYLTGKSRSINIKIDDSSLSPFQLKVLIEIKRIPFGELITYGDIAKKIHTKGYQAIGRACGRNPFLLIYPCHRVVASNHLGGFAYGLDMKRELLKLEGHLL